MPRLFDRFNFAKVSIILTITFLVSLGLCGLTAWVLSSSTGELAVPLGFVELAVMVLSLVALVLTLMTWAVVSVVRRTQRLFEEQSNQPEDKN